MFWYAIACLAMVLGVGALLVSNGRSIGMLRDVPLPADGEINWPKVSVIVAARNEQEHLEAALRSLLKIDYQPLEITVVDDRSTDATGAILDRLAAEQPALNVVHLTELPPGWLGKNHALQLGAERSSGEWLLFTDADIKFEPTMLRRAVRYSLENKLDHLSLTPETHMPTWLLESFVITFAMFFTIFTRPWKVRDMNSRAHVGIGAFNLVRTTAYQDVDGHRRLKMRPDDDLKLGKVLKLAGHQPDVLNGVGMLSVPWYGSLREVFVGLEKNTFAAVEYRVSVVMSTTLATLAFNVSPFVMPLFTDGATRWIFVAAAVAHWLLAWGSAIGLGSRQSAALGYPIAVTLFVLIQWRSMFLALKNGGIRWRDTFYSLAELRANRV